MATRRRQAERLRPWWTLAVLGLAAARGDGRTAPARVFALDNGLKASIAAPARAAGLCQVLFAAAAGRGEEAPAERGAAAITALALFAGPLPDGSDDTRSYLERQGATLDIAVDREMARFELVIPVGRCLAAVTTLAPIFARAQLPAARWTDARRERRLEQARQEADTRGQVDRRIARRLAPEAEPEGAAAAARPETAGDKASREPDFDAFLARVYSADRMTLAVRSELPAAAVEAAIRQAFGPLQRRLRPGAMGPRQPLGAAAGAAARGGEAAVPALPASQESLPAGGHTFECVADTGIDPPLLAVGRRVEVADDQAYYGWQVLAEVLGGSHSSRLAARLRYAEQLVYSIEAACLPAGRDLLLRVACQTRQVARSQQIIEEEMARLASQPLSARELATAVAILKSRVALDRESPWAGLRRWSRQQLGIDAGRDAGAADRQLDGLTAGWLMQLAKGAAARPEMTVLLATSPLCAAAAGAGPAMAPAAAVLVPAPAPPATAAGPAPAPATATVPATAPPALATLPATASAAPRPAALPRGFPPVPVPPENPMTPAKVTLGERLFFEPALSADGTVSCSSCHLPERAFADRASFSKGVGQQLGARNAPTLLNAAYAPRLLWDGLSGGLEDQVRYPVTHPKEMNMTYSKVAAALGSRPEYPPLFAAAFGDPAIDFTRVSRAIASFERTLIAGDSPFDRFYFNGVQDAIPEAARRGWALFQGKAACASCHTIGKSAPFFTDFEFYNVGVGWDADKPDLGRYQETKDKADRGRFKTPGLRDVAVTGPYMHDGSLPTLAAVVAWFDRGGLANSYLDEKIQPLHLTPQEQADLVAFLETLTSTYTYRRGGNAATVTAAGGKTK